jgi:hypothetical protein
VHFPSNLSWTNAMQIVKGMVPYAAVAMDEVERVGRRLKARAAEADLDRVWREATQPGEWDGYLKAELARYTKIIKDANINPE